MTFQGRGFLKTDSDINFEMADLCVVGLNFCLPLVGFTVTVNTTKGTQKFNCLTFACLFLLI